MPVSRYQLRNEYSLADPELYGAADRDDSEAVLEGVAMAGLVGLLRQLGDLAEFAAGIFHDLHEEVMTTAARGHGLMIRVQQLEADFPSIEKAILSLTNHSHFTYNAGIKWHASLRLDQNLITQGDYPRFIMDSYEECRGPPRLFLLDKFDIAGAGACLKRYSDPSIFKSEFPLSGMKREEVKREKKVRKVKKKGTRWWNEEPPEIFKASDFNAKLNKLASDENNVSDKTPSHGVKLKRRHLNGSSYNSRTGKSYMECILDTHLPKLFPELNEINTEDLRNRFLYKEKNLVQSPNRLDVFKLPMIELGKNVINGGYVKTKHMPIAEYKAGEISSTFNQAHKDLLADGISMIEVSANGYGSKEFELEKIPIIVQLEDRQDALVDRGSVAASDAVDYRLEDATSELDNYMDALTAMESEMGTDTNIKVKHEPGFCKDIRQVDSNLTDEQQELYAQCLDTYSVKTSSVASHDWSGSLENQESCHSDLETTSSSDLQTSLGNEVGSLDIPENCEVLSPSEQAVLGLTNSNSCLRSAEKLKSSSNEVASDLYLYQIHDMSSEKLSSNGDILGSESSETLLSNVSGNDVPDTPSHIPELGESPSTSFITGSASTCGHSSLVTSLHEIQPDRLHLAEVFLGSLEIDGESPSNPDEIEKQVGDDIPHGAGISIVSSETNEGVHFIQFAEKFTYGSSSALLQSSDSLDWSRGMKDDNGISKEVFPIEYAEDCSAAEMMRGKTLDCISGDLPVIKPCDLPSGTNDDSILERAPMEYVEEGPGVDNSSSGKVDSLNLMKEEPEILTKEYQDASSGGTLPQTYSTNVQTVKYSLVIENGVLPNENSESSSSAIDCQETDGFQGDFDKMTTGSILLKSLNFYDVGLLESHLEDLGELPNESSGREALSSNSQESTASESEVKDENVRDHLSSFNVMESSSLHFDLSLLPMEPNFTVEGLPVAACSQSDDVGARCILVEKKLVDCVPKHISPKASSNCNQVQDECFSSERVPDLYGHQSNESSNQGVLIGSQNELNPLVVGSTGLHLFPSTPDSPAASGFLGCAHHPVEIHIHSGNENSEAFIVLTESDQESELKSPHHSHCLKSENGAGLPTSFHFEPAITSEQEAATTSEQAPVVHAVLNQSTASENEEGSSPQCSDLQFETARSLEQMGSSHDFKEGIPPLCDHEVDGWKSTSCSSNSSTLAALAPILPALKLTNTETVKPVSFEQQPNQPVLVFPLTDPNPLLPSLEEMPPLPPLPPLEWRLGRLQYGSLFLGQETMCRQSSFPQLPTREKQNVQQGFSTTGVSQDSLNSSVLLPTTEDGVLQPIFQSLFGETPQLSKLLTPLPAEEADKPQHGFFTFGKEMAVPPRSSSAPLPNLQAERKDDKPQDSSQPATVDDESQCMLQTSVSEMPQPPNSFAQPPTSEVGKPQYGFSILEEKMVPSQSSSTPPSSVEFEKDSKLRDASLTVEGKMLQPLRSHLTPPIAEDEKIQHGSFASDGERTEPPNPFSSSPILEDKKPNGNVQPKPTRLRDPLIEGVASHKRVLLRRASERIRPEVKLKADEKDSLLEQIRSKSFNLRPAAMKKPALHGPKTNLNVAAILEKANAIRQAFAGSDEDDENGWSDS